MEVMMEIGKTMSNKKIPQSPQGLRYVQNDIFVGLWMDARIFFFLLPASDSPRGDHLAIITTFPQLNLLMGELY